MRKTVNSLFMLSLVLVLAGCVSEKEEQMQPQESKAVRTNADDYTSFIGKKLGVNTGAISDQIAKEYVKATPVYYSETATAIEDVRRGKIDGFVINLITAQIFTSQQGSEDLGCVEIPAEVFSAPMGAISIDRDMIDRFNVFLAEIKANGMFDDMQNRWMKNAPDLDSPMPKISLTGENGTLKVATAADAMPFAYIGANAELKGYSIELARRFAAHEGMNIEFAEMEFDGLIPYVAGGKANLAVADITITEERKESILFTDPIYDDPFGIIVLKPGGAAKRNSGGGFIEWLKIGIERNLITDNRWKMIVDGLGTTMSIAFWAQLFGTMLGCFVCFVLTRKNKLIQWIGNFYCGLIHGTPVVVLLLITYYVIFGNTNISNVTVAVAAFTLVTGASVAGNLRGAIETIDPVEIEAARSIGFSPFQAFITVTFPQAVRRALPSYTNGFVELVKATAIVGYIAIQDLTRAADIIRGRT